MSTVGQKGVDGGSKGKSGTRETEVGWMDGVKVAMGNKGMTVEAARQCGKDRKEWRALYVTECVSRGQFCLTLTVSFGPRSRALVFIT